MCRACCQLSRHVGRNVGQQDWIPPRKLSALQLPCAKVERITVFGCVVRSRTSDPARPVRLLGFGLLCRRARTSPHNTVFRLLTLKLYYSTTKLSNHMHNNEDTHKNTVHSVQTRNQQWLISWTLGWVWPSSTCAPLVSGQCTPKLNTFLCSQILKSSGSETCELCSLPGQ